MLRPSYSDILEVITQDSEDITIASTILRWISLFPSQSMKFTKAS